DGDGYPDLVLGSTQSGEVRLAINDGTGAMRSPPVALPSAGAFEDPPYYATGVSHQVFADFTNDGRLGFATVSRGGVDVPVAQSDGTFKHTAFFGVPGDGTPSYVTVGDLNTDGIPDIIAGDALGAAAGAVYLGNGDGTFRLASTFRAAYDIGNITLADV